MENKLSDFLRNKILKEVIEPTELPVSSPKKSIPTAISPTIESKMKEHKNALQSIMKYARLIKKDDKDWDESDWNGYDEWLKKNEKKVKDMSTDEVIESVFQSKTRSASSEEESKSKIRKQILEAGFGDFEKTLKKFNF